MAEPAPPDDAPTDAAPTDDAADATARPRRGGSRTRRRAGLGFAAVAAAWLGAVAYVAVDGEPVRTEARAVGEEIAAEDAVEVEDVTGAREPTASVEVPLAEREASDRGVTPEAIRFAVMHPAADFLSDAAGVSYSGRSTAEVVQPFVDEINAEGGINGRRLEPRFIEFNPIDPETMQAACLQAAEDDVVFAALPLGGLYGDGEVCMGQREIPTLTPNTSSADVLYRRDEGYVRQTAMSKDRTLKSWADWLLASGTATPDTRIAVVYADVPEDTPLVQDVFVPYLEEIGFTDVEAVVLDLSDVDGAMASARRVADRLAATRAEVVLPVSGNILFSLVLGELANIGYQPTFSASDFGSIARDDVGYYPAEQWAGTEGITSGLTGEVLVDGVPDTEAAQECLDVYTADGREIARDASQPEDADAIEVGTMLLACQQLALFADAARRAGPNPTRASLLEAIDDTGLWTHRVTTTPSFTFEPGKYDGADEYAVVRFQGDCVGERGCYRRVEPFRRSEW